MCLLLIANKIHPEYKIIIAANRDEFYNRPALKAGFWEEKPGLLAGRDLEGGGTWLGITKSGRFSAVTNYRDFYKEQKQNAPTRGKLTTDFLLGSATPEEYSGELQEKADSYNGFNLIYGVIDNLFYYSNETDHVVKIEAGLYGLSNALLNTSWPKVSNSKKYISELIKEKKVSNENLFNILADKKPAADNLLPDTGVGAEREKVLSSNFIKTPGYGTRCSTVILINNNDEISFTERTFKHDSEQVSEVKFEFNIER